MCAVVNETLGPIAASFWQNEELATGLGKDITLDGVVCMVDCVFGQKVSLVSFWKKFVILSALDFSAIERGSKR